MYQLKINKWTNIKKKSMSSLLFFRLIQSFTAPVQEKLNFVDILVYASQSAFLNNSRHYNGGDDSSYFPYPFDVNLQF